MTNKMMFEVETAEIIEEEPSSEFATARISAFSTGTSKHLTTCDLETLKRTASTIYEKPIVFEYDHRTRDFGGHSNQPIISGFIVPNSAEFFERPDGRWSLSVLSRIWKRYAPKFIDTFKETNTKKRSVSVEIQINKSEDMPDGLLKLLDWTYTAVCVLGEFVTPASPGAEIQMLSFATNENREYKKAYEHEFSSRYNEVDFTIPEDVRKNVEKGMQGSSASSVSVAMGNYILKNQTITPQRVRQIYKFLKNKDMKEMDEGTLNLYGGMAGFTWAKQMVEQLDEIDSKQISYFEKDDVVENNEKEEVNNMAKDKINLADEEEIKEEEAKEENAKNEEMAEEPKAEDEKAEGEKSEDMMAEKKDDDKEDAKKEDAADAQVYSFNENLDVPALLNILKNEAAQYRDIKEMSDVNFAVNATMGEIAKGKDASLKAVTAGMINHIESASKVLFSALKQNKTLLEENKTLKEFKSNVETERKEYEVKTVLKEAFEAGMPEAEIEACRAEAKNFSLEDIDSYKNMVKAKAFQYFGKRMENQSDGIIKMAFPFTAEKPTEPALWK